VVIATRNAVEDEKVLEWALAQKCMYLGMLGSDTKRRKLIERAKKRGLPSSGSSHLRCPAGMEIAAETPQEIAVSIMAEIISILRGI